LERAARTLSAWLLLAASAAAQSLLPGAAGNPAYALRPAGAVELGHDLKVDTLVPPTTEDVYQPKIACAPGGYVHHVWLQAVFASPASHKIFCRSSASAGASLAGPPVRVDSTPAPNGFDDPQVAADDLGHVYVVWKHYKTFSTNIEVWFARSSDHGQTFEHDVRIDTATGNKWMTLPPRIACDDAGHVYVAWADSRLGGYHVFLQRSADFGASWAAADLRVDHNVTGNRAENPQLATDGPGQLVVVWEDNRQSANSLFGNRSIDGGGSFLPGDAQVDDNPPGSGYVVFSPALAADGGGRAYALWSDLRNGSYQAWTNRSTDGGASWGDDQRADHGPGGISTHPPALACDGHGNVYGCWHYGLAPQVNAVKCFLGRSTDFGASWSATDTRLDSAAPTFVAQYAQVAADDLGRVVVTWVQEPYCSPACINAEDIYVNVSTSFGQQWAPTGIRLDSAPPNTNQSNPLIATDGLGGFHVNWRDNRNNAAFGDPLIDVYAAPLRLQPSQLPTAQH